MKNDVVDTNIDDKIFCMIGEKDYWQILDIIRQCLQKVEDLLDDNRVWPIDPPNNYSDSIDLNEIF